MAFHRRRYFKLNEEEILQFLTAENSEDEDDLCLDEEDLVFLEGDVNVGAAFCEIDDNAVETTEQVVEITEQVPRIPENYTKKRQKKVNQILDGEIYTLQTYSLTVTMSLEKCKSAMLGTPTVICRHFRSFY